MATDLLRKVKSTIYAPHHRNKHSTPATPNPNPIDISAAVGSPLSFSTRRSLLHTKTPHRSDTVTEIRRRLTRKTSTVSLRAKTRKGEKSRDRKFALPGRGHSRPAIAGEDLEKTVSAFSTPSRAGRPIYELPAENKTPTQEDFPHPTQKAEIGRESGVGSWVKMSADTITPPIPFLRLKEIATNACSSALASQSSYVHSLTESWNTQIINSILGALVQETTPPSASQPQWKYVVNSTIIQHAASSSSTALQDDPSTKKEGGLAGRRGMHSASGAYWNNERDGMWSFKYEAAEAKGLDVVVGVIWIWVG